MIPEGSKIQPGQPSFYDNRRRHGRIKIDDVTTDFGDLLDLSASGMRVRMSGKPVLPGSIINCAIDGPDGPIVVQAKAVWCRQVTPVANEVGFEFTRLSPTSKKAISELARYTTHTRAFEPLPPPSEDSNEAA